MITVEAAMPQSLEPAREMLSAIEPHVFEAVAMTVYLNRWDDAAGELMPKLFQNEMATAHRLIRMAAQTSLLLSVCRSWDTTNDARSFPKLAGLLSDDAVKVLIAEKKQEVLELLLGEIASFRGSEQLKALRVSRTEGFAHNIQAARAREEMGQAARKGEYRELYEASMLCMDLLKKCHDILHGGEIRIEEWQEKCGRLFSKLIADIPNYNS